MIEGLWLYCVLPLISAVICCYLLKNLITRKSHSESLLLFGNLALMNVVQMAGYIAWAYSQSVAEFFADTYLITAYFFFTHLTLFAITLSEKPLPARYLKLFYIFPALLMLFHFSGLMVDSYRFEQNALMHNDGMLAWSFDLFALSSCFVSATILWKNAKANKNNRMIASKNIIALISFVPLIMAFSIIILLSEGAYAIPIVIIGPTITIYTAITFYYLQRDSVIDVSIGINFFWQRVKLAYLLLETHKTKTDLKTLTKAIEKQFIIEALEENQGNIQETADYLGINHTTLRNKIKEYAVPIVSEKMTLSR